MNLRATLETREWKRHLRWAMNNVPDEVAQAVEAAAHEGRELIQERTPVITGRLRESTKEYQVTNFTWEIHAAMPYAPYVEAKKAMFSRSRVEIMTNLAQKIGLILDKAP